MQYVKTLVIACLEEARQKHLVDCINDEYLNEDYHLEVTLTVEEIRNAAKELGIKDF